MYAKNDVITKVFCNDCKKLYDYDEEGSCRFCESEDIYIFLGAKLQYLLNESEMIKEKIFEKIDNINIY